MSEHCADCWSRLGPEDVRVRPSFLPGRKTLCPPCDEARDRRDNSTRTGAADLGSVLRELAGPEGEACE